MTARRKAYNAVTGSERAACAALEQLWSTPGHSASFEHDLVAEVDGRVAGVLIGFAARDRYRLHFALLGKGLRYASIRRWPLLIAALAYLIAATPRPPRRAYYVGTIAIARHARRRGVASTLGYHAELAAQRRGFPIIVAHTGSRHRAARRALERYGLSASKDRGWRLCVACETCRPESFSAAGGLTMGVVILAMLIVAADWATKELAVRKLSRPRIFLRLVTEGRPVLPRSASPRKLAVLWVVAAGCAVAALLCARPLRARDRRNALLELPLIHRRRPSANVVAAHLKTTAI